MKRRIKKISIKVNDENIISDASAIITGGNTSGFHTIIYDGNNFQCDCIGFTRHGRCRHTDILKAICYSTQQHISQFD